MRYCKNQCMSSTKRSLAILASGGGSTALAVLEAIQSGHLTGIQPRLIVASKITAGIIEKVRTTDFPDEGLIIISPNAYSSEAEFGATLLNRLQEFEIDLVAQLGWLPKTPTNVIDQYQATIFNQHPGALDPPEPPDFVGRAMYGRAAIAAALYFQQTPGSLPTIEATTHLVTPQFDQGLLLRTEVVPIQPDDTVESLQARLLPAEHKNVIATLAEFAQKRESPHTRSQRLITKSDLSALAEAKTRAISDYPRG